jgi:hypothetical protein
MMNRINSREIQGLPGCFPIFDMFEKSGRSGQTVNFRIFILNC